MEHTACATTMLAFLPAHSHQPIVARRDRIVVSTLRCGRSNPGSNPGHGIAVTMSRQMGCLLKRFKYIRRN